MRIMRKIAEDKELNPRGERGEGKRNSNKVHQVPVKEGRLR